MTARSVGLSARTIASGRAALDSARPSWRRMPAFAGPAVIASIAYVDPGNFAANIEAGAKFGYMLLWVVVVANLLAMFFQAQSAKIGIVTGRSLASLCREQFPAPLVIAMWAASEVAAMATDLAEFLGGAIGLSLLTGLPLLPGLVIVGLVTYGLLTLQSAGFRPLELVIGGFVTIISLAYCVELVIAPPDWRAFALHAVTPQLQGGKSIELAVAIIGATIMPHAIYLHSSLTRDRIPAVNDAQRSRSLWYSNREAVLALGLAGLVNMAMLAMAAAVFHDGAHNEVADIETAYRTLMPLLGWGAGAVFMLALLCSGVSSSVVGTMAGQEIMKDFVGFRTPLWLRRLITMIPAFIVVALGVEATRALVLSQVVLSMVLPVPLLAMIALGRRSNVMGAFATSGRMTGLAVLAATAIILLNAALLAQVAGVGLWPE